MPRIVNAQQNEVKFWDNISGSQLVVYYRQPTTSERQEYQNLCVKREGNKVTMNKSQARLVCGLKIMTGFRDGDFVREKKGKLVPMASEQGSSNFIENWKEEIEKGAGDIVMLLAAHVFDSPAEISGDDIEGK